MNNAVKANKPKIFVKVKDGEGTSGSSSSDDRAKLEDHQNAKFHSTTDKETHSLKIFSCFACFRTGKDQGIAEEARLIKAPEASSDSSAITKGKSTATTAVDKTTIISPSPNSNKHSLLAINQTSCLIPASPSQTPNSQGQNAKESSTVLGAFGDNINITAKKSDCHQAEKSR